MLLRLDQDRHMVLLNPGRDRLFDCKDSLGSCWETRRRTVQVFTKSLGFRSSEVLRIDGYPVNGWCIHWSWASFAPDPRSLCLCISPPASWTFFPGATQHTLCPAGEVRQRAFKQPPFLSDSPS